uniref:Putative nuclease HARBI1 n=1 Tax=Caenorhabditis japonica TaxID=281687 RepID=A0A8R1IFW5_CAEJA
MLGDDLRHKTKNSHALSPAQQLVIFVQSLGSGGYQIMLGDLAGTSQSTVSRIISKTAEVILQNSNAFVEWPNDEERSRIADRFLALTNIPGIIGAIDGVQVPMIAPKQNEYLFVNRKGRHAINVVAVSDHRRAFLWYSRAYPGSAHDSRIFRESRLHSELSSRIKKGVLLGDSAFQAERFLLKPVLDTPADSPGILN